ncbi:unannotated protein [freshwater metagenome]|uniref:Unannotated protein n=1 Tax=freshwater metagenome TaxID=449393 RepID=A0A6J6HYL9_9ZZZZ|nr:hypothetical protein [Actinomycetota bacterium]
MKKPLLVLVLVTVLSACQVGSETALRQDLEQKFPTDNSTLEIAPIGWYKGAVDDPLMTWDEANSFLKDLKIDGKKGWRLPTGYEMSSLCDSVDTECSLGGEFDETGFWWLATTIPNSEFAAVISPSHERSFVLRAEKLRFRPVNGQLDPDYDRTSILGTDLEDIVRGGCFNQTKDTASVAWMKTCSDWGFCDRIVGPCVLDISKVVKDRERTLVAVATPKSIDTYEFLSTGEWVRIASQVFDWIIDPKSDMQLEYERVEAEIGLTDFSRDGLSDLAIRVGPPGISGQSMDLAVFRWNPDKGGWVPEKFPDPNVENRLGSLVPNPKMLRWGHVDGPDVYENFGYFETGNFLDDVSLHYRWVNGRFRYMGEVGDVASQQCLLCPAGGGT